METTLTKIQAEKGVDFLPLNGTDFVEFYVGNAKQSAYLLSTSLGI
jgi:4-hydroxyphenylpyruvate dioxygenase